MAQSQYSREEVVQLGEAIYEQKLRSDVERDRRGEFLALDIVSREYEIAPEDAVAVERLLERQPDAVIFAIRIGHRAAYRIGGLSGVHL